MFDCISIKSFCFYVFGFLSYSLHRFSKSNQALEMDPLFDNFSGRDDCRHSYSKGFGTFDKSAYTKSTILIWWWLIYCKIDFCFLQYFYRYTINTL